MIKNYSDFLNTKLKFTDTICMSTSYLHIIDLNNISYIKELKEYLFSRFSNNFKIELYNQILLKNINIFIQKYIISDIRKFNIGIKNIIANRINSDFDVYMNFIVNKDFVENIKNKLNNDPKYSKEKINKFFPQKNDAHKFILDELNDDEDVVVGISLFIYYKMQCLPSSPNKWSDVFEKFMENIDELKNVKLYIIENDENEDDN